MAQCTPDESELNGYKERLDQLLKVRRQQPIGSIGAAHNAKQIATVKTLIQAHEAEPRTRS
jgi:hypothetical protein